jgi:hypothetical protein
MFTLDEDVLAALEESHEPGWTAASFYGSEETEPLIPLTEDGSISFDADGQIQARGRVFLAKDSDRSLVPKAMTDPLAPFGQELALSRTISVGGELLGEIPMGRFRITDVPDPEEYFARYPSQRAVVGWSVELELQDRFEAIEADDFIETTGPGSGATCWGEIRRLSPYPIERDEIAFPDKNVPRGTVYRSRRDAIQLLATALGGTPAFTRSGTLTVRQKDRWMTATEEEFEVNGTISMSNGYSNKLYNQVQVTSTTGGNDLVGTARITDPSNPLAVSRPLGGRTYRTALPLESKAELDSAASRLLRRLSTRQAATVRVKCLPRADLDLGDFGLIRDPASGREVVGEVAGMTFPMNPRELMDLLVVAAETR